MINDALYGVMLPGLLGGVAMLVGWPPWRTSHLESTRGRSSVAVGLALALLASFVYVSRWWTLGPEELWGQLTRPALWQRPVLLGVVAAIVGLVSVAIRRGWAPWVAGLVLAAAAGLVVKPPGDPEHPVLGVWALALAVLVLHWGLTPLARRRPGVTLPLATLVTFGAASFVIVQTRNAKLGLLAGSLAAAASWAVPLAWFSRRLNFGRAGVAVISTMLPALVIAGAWYDYGEVPTVCFPLVAFAPMMLWFGEQRWVRRRRPWVAALIDTALVSIPLAIAIVLILRVQGDDLGDLGY